MGGYPVPSRGRQSNRCGAEQGEAGESESEEMRGQSRGQSDGVMRLPARRMGDRDGGQSHLQMAAAAAAKTLQSCLTLCDPIDSSPPGSSVLGILQARILERVAISFFKACVHGKSLQSCPTLCDPMDSSPPGSSVHRILQARILEWVAISFSSKWFLEGGKDKESFSPRAYKGNLGL